MKKRLSITQKEIAKRAGVSQTVVSLALNSSYDITLSDETRQRVQEVAAELGYVPQAAAKSLVKGHTNNIGLVLVQPHQQVFRDPFIPNVITGLSAVIRSFGYRLLVEHIDDLDHLITISNLLKGGEVAGIVLSTFEGLEEILAPLIDDGYPMVMLDESPASSCSVLLDHWAGVRIAAEHIASLERYPVACICFGPANPYIDKRLQRFCDTIEQRTGRAVEQRYIRYGQFEPESGYVAMKSLLEETPRPAVVFGMNDMMALGAIRAILDAGLTIPDEIAVVGYDDMRFAEYINPTLTTVRAPEVEVGSAAGQVLMNLINGQPMSERQVRLLPQLIVRASSRK